MRVYRFVSSDEATLALVRAMWTAERRTGRLTQAWRADVLGLSPATANRMFAGQGVDRATLQSTYRALSLEWDDACCEPTDLAPPRADLPAVAEEPPDEIRLTDPPRRNPIARRLAGERIMRADLHCRGSDGPSAPRRHGRARGGGAPRRRR